MDTLYTIVTNRQTYKDCIISNKWLPKELFRKKIIPAQEGQSFGELYNKIIDELPLTQQGWMLFCSESFVLLEPIYDILQDLDTSALYGFLGYKLQRNLQHKVSHNILGTIQLPFSPHKTGFQRYIQLGGFTSDFGVSLDAIGGGCLLIHTDLARTIPVRFDTMLRSAFLIELFSQKAIKEGIPCHLLPLECCLDTAFLPVKLTYTSKENNIVWQNLRKKALENYPQFESDQHLYKKICKDTKIKACLLGEEDIEFPLRTVAKTEEDIYRFISAHAGENNSIFISSNLMKPESNVLDMGCAQGDVGAYFKEKRSVHLWGMEYNKNSVNEAKKKGIYNEVIHVDLEQISLPEFSRFQHFFDHIFLGDILEHLRSPLDLLQKCAFFLRPQGSILVSLPNVNSGEVVTNLLQKRFEYRDSGVLDATHLRFFTAKSQAELFTKAGYLVNNSLATFEHPSAWSHQLRKDIPAGFYKKLFEDKHFSVIQYVSEIMLTDKDFVEVSKHNYATLATAPERSITMWQNIVSNFTFTIDLEYHLSSGAPYPESVKNAVKEFLEKGDVFTALSISGLFNENWYKETYPEALDSQKESAIVQYIRKGWKEGNKPSIHFDAEVYLKNIPPEINIAGVCPVLHFLQYGIHHDIPYKKV